MPAALERSHHRVLALIGDGEQAGGILPIVENLLVDFALAVVVEGKSGEVLQAQVIVAVDLRILEPRLEIGCLPDIRSQQLHGRIEPHFAQRLRDRAGRRAAP